MLFRFNSGLVHAFTDSTMKDHIGELWIDYSA